MRLSVMLGPAHIVRPDEIYQTVEPAYYEVFGHGSITWEWQVGLRSWLFPDFLAWVIRLSTVLHAGHAFYLPMIFGVLSFIAALTVAMAFWVGWQYAGWTGALLCGGFVGFWPDAVFLGPRALTEVVSGNILTLAAGFSLLPTAKSSATTLKLAAIGMLLAMAFILRLQLIPSVLFIAGWTCRNRLRDWKIVGLNMVPLLFLLGLNDWINWKFPFYSVWKNIDLNLFHSVANQFGVSSPLAYLSMLISAWHWIIIPLAALFFLGRNVTRLFPAITILTIVTHSLIPHKEVTFIYGALPSALIAVGLGAARLTTLINIAPSVRAACVAGLIPLLVMLNVWQDHSSHHPDWYDSGHGVLPLWVEAGQSDDFCGLGVYGNTVPLAGTGGYSYLNRSGAIYLLTTQDQFNRAIPNANYILTDQPHAMPKPYQSVHCAGNVCLLKRTGGCDTNTNINLRVPTFPAVPMTRDPPKPIAAGQKSSF